MNHLLDNPVYNALSSGDAHFSFGSDKVKFFEEQVSPFAGFDNSRDSGFEELHNLLAQDRKILYAIPKQIETPKGWKLLADVAGLQFVMKNYLAQDENSIELFPLGKGDIEAILKLTALTKPGPFNKRTIEFGHYFGIFRNEQLVAMTGQRLHVSNFTEISAVCTHPDYLGNGFARALLHHQIKLILQMGQIPFLHVRSDNQRAIELYESLGFEVSRPMHFYFLQKK